MDQYIAGRKIKERGSGADEIYQPAEDTFLLLEAARKEAKPDDSAIEIGCGSAIISREISPLVKSIIATDINPHAARKAQESGVASIRADLFRGINAKFDLVIFNPPYLPTSDEERVEGWINFALDGGAFGRDTISVFLRDLKHHLNPGGRALLLISSLSGPLEVERIARSAGLDVAVVASERYFFEQLSVIRLMVAHSTDDGDRISAVK